MMRSFTPSRATFMLAFLLLVLSASGASARPTFFASRCAGCHNNDSVTCDGCHNHSGGTLSATADAAQYTPGAPVTITLHGGSEGGWVRGILYNQSNVEIARRSGPTGMGDDGQAGAVTFPVQFNVTAPATAGDYTWQAAWFGNWNDTGSVHQEERTPVVIHVVGGTSGVPSDGPSVIGKTWGMIKEAFRR